MKPFMFAGAQGSLFGAYHPPCGRTMGLGLVTCYSAFWEYQAFYPAFVSLADRLSGHGCPVLRFDYCGYGDSAGDGRHASLEDWVADTGCAIEELRRRSSCEQVFLIGHRLGGTIALAALAHRSDIEGLILWDPVINGRAYLSNMRRLEQLLLIKARGMQAPPPRVDETLLTGYPFPGRLREAIEGYAFRPQEWCDSARILLIESPIYDVPSGLKQQLQSQGCAFDYERFSPSAAGGVWSLTDSYVPVHLLERICCWVAAMLPYASVSGGGRAFSR